MLTKAIVLILIGASGGSPVSKAIGPFANFKDCQQAAAVYVAAALMVKHVTVGMCVQTPFVFEDHKS